MKRFAPLQCYTYAAWYKTPGLGERNQSLVSECISVTGF